MTNISDNKVPHPNSDEHRQTLSKNLTFLLASKGIETKEIAKATGISATNINNLKRGATNPTLSTIEILANYFSIPLTKLISDDLTNDASKTNHILQELPLLTIDEISEFSGVEIINTKKFRATTIDTETKEQKRFIVQLSNNSMAPLYEKGTLFIINSDLPFTDGDMVLCKSKSGFSSIRKIYVAGEKAILHHPTLTDSTTTINTSDLIIHGVIEKIVQEP